MQKRVAFDFDGVIHDNTKGWKGRGVITGAPVPGIKESIAAIREAGYEVVVISSRCRFSDGFIAVDKWLADNEIQVDGIYKDKVVADVYIDDRAICFDGDAAALPGKIKQFKPWNK